VIIHFADESFKLDELRDAPAPSTDTDLESIEYFQKCRGVRERLRRCSELINRLSRREES